MNKIGLNLSGLNNITAPTFDAPDNSTDFLQKATDKINELTGGYWGLVSLTILFTYLWITLNDKTEYGEFRYSMTRSLGISAMISGIMGYFMVAFGYFNNYFHVAIFLGLGMVTTIWVYIEEKSR